MLALAVACNIAYAIDVDPAPSEQFVKDHVAVKTSETMDSDAEGTVTQVTTTDYSYTTITQRTVERKKRDKQGVLRVVGLTRTTDVKDTKGGRSSMVESLVIEGGELVVDRINDCQQTPTGSITTVKGKNQNGELAVKSRRTVSKNDTGLTTTTVETPDRAGTLVMRQIIESQQTLDGSITTVNAIDKQGRMLPTARTTVSTDEDGLKTVMVERADKTGALVLRQMTTESTSPAE